MSTIVSEGTAFLTLACRGEMARTGELIPDQRDLVSCGTHGARPAAFVCRHVLESLHTRSPVGFNTPEDADDDDQGWCDACERVRAREGEWNERSEAYADIRLICLDCFRQARALKRPL